MTSQFVAHLVAPLLRVAVAALAGSLPTAAQAVQGDADAGNLHERDVLLGDPAGLRSDLAKQGVRLESSLITDYSHVIAGGAEKSANVFRHLLEVGLTIETQPLVGLEGGTFFASFATQHGPVGSERVGDFQVFSNIDETDFTAIYEFYYQQRLLDDRLRIKVGKVDANEEFAFVEHGDEFIHSSPGFSPTIQAFPSYPDPATSVNVFVYPNDWLYVGLGVYDGAAQAGYAVGRRGPGTFFGKPSDLFLISELGLTYHANELPGRIGAGVWRHTGTFARFDGGSDDGTSGFYFIFDQLVFREPASDPEDPQGLGLFAQYGWADPRVSEAEHHLGVGTQWAGALPNRDDDVTGVMASYVHFSDEPGAGFTDEGELAVELFYKAQITPRFSLKPDVQYILSPGGTALPDAWVGTLRVELAF